MMDVLRRHGFFIGCGAVAALGVALAVLGMTGMGKVRTLLAEDRQLYTDLQGLQGGAVNEDRIKVEERRIEQTRADREKVVKLAQTLIPYEPLMKDFFPEAAFPKQDEFKKRYVAALNAMLVPSKLRGKAEDSLRYGLHPSIDDVEFWAARIKRDLDRSSRDPGPGQVLAAPGGPKFDPRTWTLMPEVAATDKTARATMDAAQKCYLYATRWDQQGTSSLHWEKQLFPSGQVQTLDGDLFWRAQVQLWIQQDVLDAIKRMNDKAAKVHAETAGKTGVYDGPWVGIMPVKEIISIRVSDHLKQDDDKVEQLTWGRVGGPDEAKPAGSPYPTFTNTQGSDTYDAVQFSVKLIMDQRDLMQFADELTRGRFHTLLRVSYVSNSDVFDRTYYGTVYGSEPTVNVLFDFESILPVDRYRAIMPDVVLEYLEVERPVTEEAGEEPAGETEQP